MNGIRPILRITTHLVQERLLNLFCQATLRHRIGIQLLRADGITESLSHSTAERSKSRICINQINNELDNSGEWIHTFGRGVDREFHLLHVNFAQGARAFKVSLEGLAEMRVGIVRFHGLDQTGEATLHSWSLVQSFEGVKEVDVVDQKPASWCDKFDDAGKDCVPIGKLQRERTSVTTFRCV